MEKTATESAKRTYNLLERTRKFGEEIIRFAYKLPNDPVIKPIKSQLVRSGTSIGANYCEAIDAESAKDFIHKIGICKKEANETKYWIQVIVPIAPMHTEQIKNLYNEAHELNLIFQKSIFTAKNNLQNRRSSPIKN